MFDRLIERGYTHFISGAAMGFDTWVAEDVIELQKKNKELYLECAIPCPDQDKQWDPADQKRRRKNLKKANESTLVCVHYSSSCFLTRNRYMLDKADVVGCAYDGQSGDTAYNISLSFLY